MTNPTEPLPSDMISLGQHLSVSSLREQSNERSDSSPVESRTAEWMSQSDGLKKSLKGLHLPPGFKQHTRRTRSAKPTLNLCFEEDEEYTDDPALSPVVKQLDEHSKTLLQLKDSLATERMSLAQESVPEVQETHLNLFKSFMEKTKLALTQLDKEIGEREKGSLLAFGWHGCLQAVTDCEDEIRNWEG